MRKFLVALFLALVSAGALTFGPAASPASAQAAVSVSLFHRELAPHGRWFQHPRWGWAWFPTRVSADWRPYSRGNWVWTGEHGWYWVSDEPFGWAVYHYGRWAYDEEYGWIWIPGRAWGPAWVAFRYGDDHIGWAPLPPETLDASHGWDEGHTELSASYYQPRWVFIPRRYFLAHRVYTHAVPVQRNVVIIRQTVNVTRYERGRHGVFNRSIEPRRLEAALGRRVAPVRINVVADPRRVGPDRRGVTVNVFRPDVRVTRDAAPPAEARARPQDRPRARLHPEAVAPSERRERATPPTAAPGAPAETPRTVQPNDRRGPDLGRDRDGRPARDGRDREDRRETTPAQPPAAQPPGAGPPAVRTPETATPRPGTPPAAMPSPLPRSAQPDDRRGGEDRAREGRGRDDRRAAPQPGPGPSAKPPATAQPQTPRAPEMRRGRDDRAAPPGPPPAVTRPDAPRPPAASAPQRPPAAAAPPAPRSAPPSFARPDAPSPPAAAPPRPPAAAAPPPAPPRSAPPSAAPQPPRVAPGAAPQPRAQPAPPPRAQPPAPAPQQAPPAKSGPAPKEEERKGR